MKYKVKYQEYEFKIAEGEAIKTPKNLHKVLCEDYNPISEEMYLLVLNIKNKIINKYLIAKGSYNCLMSTPSDIFSMILKADGRNFVLAHNHPSGDTTPSTEDIEFTKKVSKASEIMGLNFIDHIIYTPDNYYSFRASGIIEN